MSITYTGITETINLLDKYDSERSDFGEKAHEILERLAQIGVAVAWQHYSNGNLDGNYGFDVDWHENGTNSVCVVAQGSQILFLEFGTGITYASPYPTDEGFNPIFAAGDYSKQNAGQWNNPKGWWYTDWSSGQTSVHTYGIAAKRGMYEAKKEMQNRVDEIIREVMSK